VSFYFVWSKKHFFAICNLSSKTKSSLNDFTISHLIVKLTNRSPDPTTGGCRQFVPAFPPGLFGNSFVSASCATPRLPRRQNFQWSTGRSRNICDDAEWTDDNGNGPDGRGNDGIWHGAGRECRQFQCHVPSRIGGISAGCACGRRADAGGIHRIGLDISDCPTRNEAFVVLGKMAAAFLKVASSGPGEELRLLEKKRRNLICLRVDSIVNCQLHV
jgi:hypothetical protein